MKGAPNENRSMMNCKRSCLLGFVIVTSNVGCGARDELGAVIRGSGGAFAAAGDTGASAGASVNGGYGPMGGVTSAVSTGGQRFGTWGSRATGGRVGSGGTVGTGGRLDNSGGVNRSGGNLAFGGMASETGGFQATGGSGTSSSSCILHVARSGKDGNSGSSWASALENVQPAITLAANRVGDGTCPDIEIWVARGSYKPTYLVNSADPRSATFQLTNRVALFGGFIGIESERAARDFDNVTILTGDIGIIDDPVDNSYHVVTGASGSILDGFTVTGGNANGNSGDNEGGGMFNDGASTIVANCRFVDNTAMDFGAGMYNSKGSPTITNCTFLGNAALGTFNGNGGGMYNLEASPTVTGCTFLNNQATHDGGGLANSYSSPTVEDCTFSENFAAFGGGIYNYPNSLSVINCSFSANSATYGGGMYNQSASPQVTGCDFVGNSATNGGGIFNGAASPSIVNCTFEGNAAEFGGGVDNGSQSSPVVTNCTFTGNASSGNGAALYNGQNSSPVMTNCTFAGNSSHGNGGAMYNDRGCQPSVVNCIFFWDLSGATPTEIFSVDAESNPNVTYSVVAGGYPGTGNLDVDPLLNPDLTLRLGSPAIDAGRCGSDVPTTDILRLPRWDIAGIANPKGGRGADIGAYEFQGRLANGDSDISNLLSCQ